MHDGGLRVVGTDDEHGARIVELPDHPFFVATLFVPQLTSTEDHPHPVDVQHVRDNSVTQKEQDKGQIRPTPLRLRDFEASVLFTVQARAAAPDVSATFCWGQDATTFAPSAKSSL